MMKIFCLSIYFKICIIFRQSESCVLTMLSWSRQVNICELKSFIEVQLPTVSGNLKKILYSCLCKSSVSCVLMEKIDEKGSVVTGYRSFRHFATTHCQFATPNYQFATASTKSPRPAGQLHVA